MWYDRDGAFTPKWSENNFVCWFVQTNDTLQVATLLCNSCKLFKLFEDRWFNKKSYHNLELILFYKCLSPIDFSKFQSVLLSMEDILHHLGCIKPCKEWTQTWLNMMNLPLNWLAGWDFFHQQYLFPAWLNIFGGNTFKADLITASPGGTAISGTLLNSNMAEELQNLLPVLEPKIWIWQKKCCW